MPTSAVEAGLTDIDSISVKRAREEAHDEREHAKVPRIAYSDVVKKMMASMGYTPGSGLGKEGDGIIRPIDDSSHKGRRGLGFSLEGLEKEEADWEPEELIWDQKPVWLSPCQEEVPSAEDLESWAIVGSKKDTIVDENNFCGSAILHQILSSKSVFDNLATKEFLDARQRSNPYETIKGGIFQNRAAMKMANIDKAFDWMFTNPKSSSESFLAPTGILYFADVCAGPGGFSEYVLWRRKWRAKGFGFTLKDPDSGSDFKLDQFLSAPCETFDPHYGVGGYEGDGDVTRPDNLTAFRQYVVENTDGKGVHFVMADGGISVEGQENIQELLTKQLVLCQYVCALSILRPGGHFVCKVFDMFTPFSVGLFYLLYRCFEKICIFKPVTSRPANSERYIVGYRLRSGTSDVHDYMFYINEYLIQLQNESPEEDIIHVVPPEILDQEEEFCSYVTSFNNGFGANQITNLRKIQIFVKNGNLHEARQADIRAKCLRLWKIPAVPRSAPLEKSPMELWSSVLAEYCSKSSDESSTSVLKSANFKAVSRDKLDFLKDLHSWKWCWACGKRYMLIGLGRNLVHGWDMTHDTPTFAQPNKLWNGLELPKGTVIEVECLPELTGEGSGQIRRNTVYIVDVLAIHEEIVGQRPFKERLQLAEKLCKAVNKPCRKGLSVLLKTKSFHRITEAPKHFNMLEARNCKGVGMSLTAELNSDSNFVVVRGIIFIKHIRDPWHLHLSKNGKFYYYNSVTSESTYECPVSSISPCLKMVAQRHLWLFNSIILKDFIDNRLSGSETDDSDQLTLAYLSKVISTQ